MFPVDVTIPLMPPSSPLAGKFISFEGSEGSGKSTQIARLLQHLRQTGREIVATREPGGTATGEQIRNIVIHTHGGDEMCPEAELLLYTAARAQVVREIISPALARGAVVVADRYLDSSTVYQGVARNLPADQVAAVNRFAAGGVMPHLTVLIDVPTEVSVARMQRRTSDLPDRMERENEVFFRKVRDGYLRVAADNLGRIRVFDGTKTADAIEREIWAAVSPLLG